MRKRTSIRRLLKPKPKRLAGVTVGAALRMVEEFRALLASLGVDLPVNSPAALELDALAAVMGWVKGSGEPPISQNYITTLQNAVCSLLVVELAVRRWKEGVSLDPFVNHFKLLKSGSLRLAAESGADENNHKLFELIVGLVVAAFATNVQLAHPKKTDISNPDVSATIDGLRWGFACKVPHSENIQTLHDNILKGFRQIDAAEIEAGLVVMSPKNLLKSSDAMQLSEVGGKPAIKYFKPQALGRIFEEGFNAIMNGVNAMLGAVERANSGSSCKRAPYVFWLNSTATISESGGVKRPTLYTRAGGYPITLPEGAVRPAVAKRVLFKMQEELARID